MSKNRTENAIRNVKTGFIVQLINKIMAFVVRTIFIKYLNTEYLGVNGLFTNVLTILSFAELGIGTAIIFSMYKPVAENDKEKIKTLMSLYKKTYNIIGCVVFILGLLVIPFMPLIVKDVPNINESITFIYLLFLINTSSSYFFTYKKSIIIAHQQQSVINNIDSIFYLIKSFVEIVFLILTRNFIIYLLIQIGGTILENFYLSHVSNKMYPYLKEKNIKKLNKTESKKIFNNVKSLIIYKFGGVILNGTDNILISSLINVATVGIVSNYTLIINSVRSILTSGLNGVVASVGNLNAIGDDKKKEEIYYNLTFVYYIIYSFCSISFVILLNPFINIWLGSKYLLGTSVSFALGICFFVEGMRQSGFIYRTTLGLFQKAQSTPYIGAITNIIFSILLCKIWGIVGIFIATSIAQLVSYSWIDPYLIYKYAFKKSPYKFYKKNIIYFIIFTIELIFTFLLTELVSINIYADIIVKGIIVLLIPNILNIVFFKNTKEYKYTEKIFIAKIKKNIKKLVRLHI